MYKLKTLLGLLISLLVLVMVAVPAQAATTADVTVTATPSFIAIADNATSYDFGVVSVSTNYSMPTNQVKITNTCSVITNMTISVTGATWTGGTAWTHSDIATPGADTAALWASKGAGTFNVIVKNAAPNNIAANQAATTDFNYECRLGTPTSFSDGVQKENTVRISAAAA